MEGLLPKDNENISLPDFGPLTPSEAPGFAPGEMVRCEACLRMNPPTRVDCIYCGAGFSFNEKIASQQKPSLRPLEKWEQGYSNILQPLEPIALDPESLGKAAPLLKLSVDDLRSILDRRSSLPLARAATVQEAQLVERRLKDLGISSCIVSDEELGMETSPPLRIRAAKVDEEGWVAYQVGDRDGMRIEWTELRMLVQGRLLVKSVAIKERKSVGQENELLDASETYTDEAVVDIYCQSLPRSLRIAANSFDFSCLNERKALIAKENFTTLLGLFCERAPKAVLDDSYRAMRQALEPVWPSEKQTGARGWHRERPGRYSVGAVTETSNELQFTRYSRLRNYFCGREISA